MYSYKIYVCNKKLAVRYTIIYITRKTYGEFSAKKFPDVAASNQVVAQRGARAGHDGDGRSAILRVEICPGNRRGCRTGEGAFI